MHEDLTLCILLGTIKWIDPYYQLKARQWFRSSISKLLQLTSLKYQTKDAAAS